MPALGLLAAALLYAALFPRFFVGYFSDDALYILAAKSLLTGRYVSLYLPDQPYLTQILPGYPLFLAPFVALVQPHWPWLKFLSVGLTLGSVLLLGKLLEPWMSTRVRWITMLLFAFNPTTVLGSGIVMSDPFYLF